MKNLLLLPSSFRHYDFSWINQLAYCALFTVCSYYGFVLSNYLLLIIAGYVLLNLLYVKKVTVCLLSLIGLILCLGSGFLQKQQYVTSSNSIKAEFIIYPDSVIINGDLLVVDGQMKGKLVRLNLQLKSKKEKQKWLMDAPEFTRISCVGSFQTVKSSHNQHAFDYEKFLQDKKYFGVFVIEKYYVLSGSAWQTLLAQLRFYCMKQVREHLSKKAIQYVQALVFGYKNHDFQEMQSLYSMSGILHLFTISGMHVIFFLGLFDYFFRRLHLSFAQRILPFVVCALIAMFIFGLSMSVLRATFTYLLTYLLTHLSIMLSHLDRFSIVLLFLMILFPNTLLVLSGQISLLISFLLIFIPHSQSKWQSILFTQYLHVLTAPFLFCVFFQWPILGGILTVVFSYLFTFLLLPYCFVLFLMTFIPLLLPFFNLPFDWIVRGVEYCLQFFVNFQLNLGTIPSWLVGICLILGLLFLQSSYHYLVPVICLLLPFLYSTFTHMFPRVTFMDVGQGACSVIQSSFNQEVIVIDTGGKITMEKKGWQKRRVKPNCNYSLVPYLKGEGIKKIDALILSHGDVDHMGDLLPLCKQFNVKKVYLTKGAHHNEKINQRLKKLPKQTKVYEVLADQIIGKKILLQVLSPRSAGLGENKDSMVLYTKITTLSFLWTGDLPKKGEIELINQFPTLKVDILQVGHHGSHTSTDEAFIQHIRPQVAIISVGEKNRYGHPHQQTIQTLKENKVNIRRTDQLGMIQYRWQFSSHVKEYVGH